LDTDKVSTELTAEKAGTLRIKVPAGQEVKIGEVVATIEDGAASPAGGKVSEPPKPAASAPPAAQPPVPAPAAPTPSAPAESKAEPPTAPPPEPVRAVETPHSSPVADAIANANVALGVPPAAPAAPAVKREGRSTRKPMSPIRRKIAAQLVMAQQTAAILTTFNECDMTAVMDLRSQMQESFTKEHGVKLGFMSFFVKACIEALKKFPVVNASVDGNDIVYHEYYDIGVAVSTERGLMVPIVRDADTKGFGAIEAEIGQYAKKAREGSIAIEDLTGGTFTITNGGVFGSLMSTPIVNSPQSAILGMHKIQERPMVVRDAGGAPQIAIRPMMYLAVTYDHRIIDGREAVQFLVAVKDCLEDPGRMLLGL
jgi:2-oxoglutarate dehydrogenase E2 component (dihydrolipoamide succinyltransferase)